MSNTTDKYHKQIERNDKHLNPLFDIKEVSKRSYQLGLAALFTGIGLSVYDAYAGIYVSSFLVACFCFAILLFMLLKYQGVVLNLTISIIYLICALLIFSVVLEGLQSDAYLYFFPVLIAVPIVIDLKQVRYKQIFIYISVILLSFGLSIIIGRTMQPLESFTVAQINKLAIVNRIVAISSTIVFAVAYIFFEKMYINELTAQSKQVINTRTQFLATMGHELRTPLNGIIGTIALMKDDPMDQAKYMQILQYCSDHMLKQVNDILDFNKIEAGQLENHPVKVNLRNLLLNSGLPFLAAFRQKGLKLDIDIDPQLNIIVLADDLHLIQIINNLFANALKFTESGYIRLKADCIHKTEKHIEVNISVQDSGIGIDSDDQELIFESFYQVYNENTRQMVGTGLGLTNCLRLLKLMNSTLVLVSDKDKGSTFSFKLTLEYPEDQYQLKEQGIIPGDNLAGVKVLLVEDNKINMLVAKKCLTGFEAIVTGTYNGREALDELALNQNYHIILMDLEMPVMNGYTAIYEVTRLYPSIPVIAFTASLVDDKMLKDLLDSGFVDCILKPFAPQTVLTTVLKHLRAESLVDR
ncbi:ATP-binding response regulator [Mucilaginibacter dorajii]|uniref:histidine kinase n=1 Tax=Mucilaginibacter dorajii TaxID=692994 RepID=A0ABP7PK61_9SPHI|nr:ATP-binding protein [Mucilaginibacter dorajii]MCS3733399.1 signal transduction histidine kinase/CheY-like chemotaxis protein [Mucilaginibacter dorajii]